MRIKRHLRNLPAIVLIVLLAACLAGAWLTRESSARKRAAANNSLIDEHMLATAHGLAALADTPEEQGLARDAVHLADHELDQDFATAIRTAEANARPATAAQKQLAARVSELKSNIAADKDRITKLTDDGELNLAKAQLELNQDELEDAQQDLARLGGDTQAKLAQALQEHESAEHDAEVPKVALAGPTSTLAEQLHVWLGLGSRMQQIEAARQDAAVKANVLVKQHEEYEKRMSANPAPGSTTNIADLHRLSDQRKTLAEFDKRIQDCQQLAGAYNAWNSMVETRRRSVLNLLLRSFALMAGILLAVLLIDREIRHQFRRHKDARRLHQMRVMSTVGVQLAGLIVIVLVIFGPPNQITTLIGLVTAGLTVALKDFIVGFFGWFALMGKDGIRIGDWVEINGVGGEVIEIGMLKTVLLEMGAWTSSGHPTGRRVSFVNSFALEGHYFNFSTAGQWLWDEISVTVPLGEDPYRTAEQIRQKVEEMTKEDAAAAEQDWEQVTSQYGTRAFSARPAVDIRPAVNGLNVVVRYITRGPQRYQAKSRIFEAIVALLRHAEAVEASS